MDDLRELMAETSKVLRETISATRELHAVQRQYLDEQRKQTNALIHLLELHADRNQGE